MMSDSELSRILAESPLFGQLAAAAREELQRHIETLSLNDGDVLVRKGETGDSMFIVCEGQLGVFDAEPGRPERLLKVMGHGEYLGEIALLRDAVRTATARAQGACLVIKLSRLGFERLLDKHPHVRALLEDTMEQRLVRTVPPPANELRGFLASVPLFIGLDAGVLADIEAELQWMTLAAGEYLFRQGDPADCLYIVVSGRLRVFSEHGAGGPQLLGELGRGQSVGEFGLLTGEPRSATVRPLRDSELIRVSKQIVDRLLDRHPHAMLGFVRSIITQARTTSAALAEKGARAIAVVPCGTSVRLSDVIPGLERALSPIGSVVHVSSAAARTIAGDTLDATDHERDPVALTRWLNDLEAKHSYVLYECDPHVTAWTRRCLRQADRILLVGHIGDDPRPSEVERKLLDARQSTMRVRVDLALIHPANTRQPSGTQRWLTERRVDSHHHIRQNAVGDIERMVRRLSGRSIGLVLSGGAAHGFSHIGVIRALREHGIDIDQVGGTSMGSVIAAQFALGYTEKEMIAGVRKVFVDAKPLTDYTVPIGSFLVGKRFANAIHEHFGEALVEDLWLGYFCVSGNLTRGEAAVHESGPLWNGVLKSCSIPGLVPPVVHGTDLHVDGGVANNLPDDVMRARGQGPVIAVDVGPAVDLSIDARYSSYPPSWQVLAHNLNPFGQVSVPTLVHILFRTAMLSSHGTTVRAQNHAALYLRPRVERFPFLDFTPVEEIVEEGYRSTHDAIAAWKNSRPL